MHRLKDLAGEGVQKLGSNGTQSIPSDMLGRASKPPKPLKENLE
jgi:hypothetical protein